MIRKLLQKLSGLHFNQEYLCLTRESFDQPLKVYLTEEGRITKDITNLHAFAGYSPLILVLPTETTTSQSPEIIFSNKLLQPNEFFSQKDALAMVRLAKIPFAHPNCNFYEGTYGSHRFVSPFSQRIIGLYNRLYQKKEGNVFLHDNLYKQVQIAYSLPRNISLITVRSEMLFNCFPTDLHGPAGNGHYVVSLRHRGKACSQVLANKKILLTAVASDAYKTVYGLGKNHMQEMKAASHFPFSNEYSKRFGLPVPAAGLSYRELELEDSFIHGIHRLLIFRIWGQEVLDAPQSSLAHIHQVYGSWRRNQGLPGNYLLR